MSNISPIDILEIQTLDENLKWKRTRRYYRYQEINHEHRFLFLRWNTTEKKYTQKPRTFLVQCLEEAKKMESVVRVVQIDAYEFIILFAKISIPLGSRMKTNQLTTLNIYRRKCGNFTLEELIVRSRHQLVRPLGMIRIRQ